MKNLFGFTFHHTMVPEDAASSAVSSEDMQIVDNANKTWNDTFNSGNSEALAELYSETATLSPGNGEVLVGRLEIAGLFQSFFDNGVHNHTIEPVAIYREQHQIVQVGKWRAEAVDDNQQKNSFGGVLVTVLQNDNGKWLLRSHVWNMAG